MPATVPMFHGSMPAFYDRYLGPVAFVPYAVEMAKRVRGLNPARVLETACGTGIVTYSIADAFPKGLEIVATDLSQPMLDFASADGLVSYLAASGCVRSPLRRCIVRRSRLSVRRDVFPG